MPLPPYAGPANERVRGFIANYSAVVAVPLYWMDETYDSRFAVAATNPSSTVTLHDQIIEIPVPDGVTVDADSMRVVETTTLGTIDHAYGWRYRGDLDGFNINRMHYLPASLSGATITAKTFGRWFPSERRTFAVYWDSTGAVAAAPAVSHLGGLPQGWTAGLTAGTTGDTYRLVINGTNYTHVMTAGQTAADIGTALAILINAGTDATATGTSTLTIKQVDGLNVTFTVTNTGSTVPGNVVVTKPNYFGLARIGPDMELYESLTAGLPYGTEGAAAIYPGWGFNGSRVVRTMHYTVNPSTQRNANSGSVTSITNNKGVLDVVGSLGFTGSEWTATYTDEYSHKIVSGRKSDDTNPDSLTKYVDVHHVVLTYTCAVAYTPAATAAGATTEGSLRALALADLDTGFGGNTTISAANSKPRWYADTATGTATAYTSSDGVTLAGLSTSGGTIFGASNSVHTMALLVNSITLANFGSQAPTSYWTTQGNGYAVLGLRNLSNAAQVPVGATITIDFWMINGTTLNPSTTGDVLLVDEAVDLLRGLAQTITPVPGSVETYTAAELAATMDAAAVDALAGHQWFVDNAASKGGASYNHAFQYDLAADLAQYAGDDDDNAYGHSHGLHGLCLRYLRTHDPALIPVIEEAVQWQIGIEQAAVTTYGTWWEGSAPYWYAAAPVTMPQEGGTASGDVDPGMPGGVFGPITYAVGQVRRMTSIDQMHMKAHGLYAYLYLLRNEAAITANTVLQADARALVTRMATFESTHWGADARVCGNLNAIVTGATPTNANGITATEYNDTTGDLIANVSTAWMLWQKSDTPVTPLNPSSNIAIDSFFRATFAPGSSVAGVTTYMQLQADSMLGSDISLHDVTGVAERTEYDSNGVVVQDYPPGWVVRASATDPPANDYKFTAGRAGDDHYIFLSVGNRDCMDGRAAQRMIALCLAALLDPTYVVPVELTGGSTVVRSMPIAEAVDRFGRSLALYGTEATTKARMLDCDAFMGQGNPRTVDSIYTGYWLMALELWYLVKAGANIADYYPIGAW